jgi:hypothetical protein
MQSKHNTQASVSTSTNSGALPIDFAFIIEEQFKPFAYVERVSGMTTDSDLLHGIERRTI